MNEYQPNKNKQRLFIQSFLFIAGSQHHHLRLAETQRQAEERKSFAEKKKEGVRCAPLRGCWTGEAIGGPARNEAS